MAIVAVSIAPLGTGDTSVSAFVAAAHRVLQKHPDLTYRLDPMFTTIQGDLRQIFSVIAEMHEAVANMGALRISTVIKIDDRRDKEAPMESKVQTVQELLREPYGDKH